jgi:predicted Zn-dependent protease
MPAPKLPNDANAPRSQDHEHEQRPQSHDIETLINNGFFHTAWQLAEHQWSADQQSLPHNLYLKARMLDRLGGDRLSDAILIRLWRKRPQHHEGAHGTALYLLNNHGPIRAWEFICAHQPASLTDKELADWVGLRALVVASFRDWEAAQGYLNDAKSYDPESDWIARIGGYILSSQEHFGEADQYLENFYRQRPSESLLLQWSRARGSHQGAEAAISLLNQEATNYESIRPWILLANYHCHTRNWQQGVHALRNIERLMITADRHLQQELAGLRAEVAIAHGHHEIACEQLALCRDEYHTQLLKNYKKNSGIQRRDSASLKIEKMASSANKGALADQLAVVKSTAPTQRRIDLDVPFVRQKHNTCVPASFAAILKFWLLPHDQNDIASAVCYGGTTPQAQRKWLLDQHYAFEEFDLTWAAACALIDAKLPFTLVTHQSFNSHMQVVIGYDRLKETIAVMDPSRDHPSEILVRDVIEGCAYSGPRGLVFGPQEIANTLRDLDLPSAEVYRLYARFNTIFDQGDLAAQHQALTPLIKAFPDHRLTKIAQREHALTLGHDHKILALTQTLLAQFPEEPALLASAFTSLKRVGRHQESLELLRSAVHKELSTDLLLLLLNELHDNHSYDQETLNLRRILSKSGYLHPETLFVLGNWYLARGQQQRALAHYRWAVCLEDTSERYATQYFQIAMRTGQTDEVLAFLEQRWHHHSDYSAGPAISLFCALAFLNRYTSAFQILEKSLAKRPEDPDLLQFYLRKLIDVGELDTFEKRFDTMKTMLPNDSRLDIEACYLKRRGLLERAVSLYQLLHHRYPLNNLYTESLFDIKKSLGLEQHIDQRLAELKTQYGDCFTILNLHQRWHSQATARHAALKRLTEIFPDHAQLRAEYISNLLGLNDVEAALAHAKALIADFPQEPVALSAHSKALWYDGQLAEAAEAARTALTYNVNLFDPFETLLNCVRDRLEKQSAFNFIRTLLQAQDHCGDGLWHYWHLARDWYDRAELLQQCQALRTRHPECWEVYVIEAYQQRDMHDLKAAEATLATAQVKFPNTPRIALEHAEILNLLGETDAAIALLEQLCQTHPDWVPPAKRLAHFYEIQGNYTHAAAILDKASHHSWHDGALKGLLADMQWRLGKEQEALDTLIAAVRLNMDYPWAWDRLRHWGVCLGKPHLHEQIAQQLVKDAPHAPAAWRILAEQSDDPILALQHLDQALRLAPWNADIHIARSELLARHYGNQDALHYLQTLAWRAARPEKLLLREIELLLTAGHTEEASTKLSALLAECPLSLDAHILKLRIIQQQDDQSELRETVENIHHLAPHHPQILCECAEALIDAERPEHQPQAQAWLARAFELAPHDPYIGLTWWDWLLRHGEEHQAIHVEQITEQSAERQWWLPRRIKRCCRSDDYTGALEAWCELLTLETDTAWPVRASFSVLTNTPLARAAIDKLEQQFNSGFSTVHSHEFWLDHVAKQPKFVETVELLLEKLPNNGARREFLQSYLNKLEERRQLPSQSFFENFRAVMQSHYALLVAMGRVLCACEQAESCVHWYQSAGLNEQTPGYVHYHFRWALFECGLLEQAAQQSRLAASKPNDDFTLNARLWILSDDFLFHNRFQFSDLEQIPYEELSETEKYIYGLLFIEARITNDNSREGFEACIQALKDINALKDAFGINQYIDLITRKVEPKLMNCANNFGWPERWFVKLKIFYYLYN